MGKSAAAPPTPDYVGAAKQQGQDNLAAAKQSNVMSNPNMYTPFGNQTVSYSSPTFDQSSYDAALSKYNAGAVDRNRFMRQGNPEGDTITGATYFDQAGYDAANAARGAAPSRDSFMTGGGQPTVTQTLNPQAQQTLDAQMRVQTALANLGQTGAANAQNVLNTPFNPNLPNIQTSVNSAGGLQSSVAPSGNIQSTAAPYGDVQNYVNSSGNIQSTAAPSGNIQNYVNSSGNIQSTAAPSGNIQNYVDSAGNVQTGLSADQFGLARANTQANTYGLASQDVNADTYGLAKGRVPLQYSLNTSNLTQMPTNAGMSAQQAILARLNPTIEAGDTSFKQALANQGLAPGTAAFDAAMRNREASKNDLYSQAALQGINLDMAARQQGLNELNTTGTFGNQAQLAGAGLYNQAVAQNFGQGMSANQLKNASVAQNFGQGVTADQLYNSAVGQNFNQGLLAQQANNAAQQQQYGQNLNNAQFANQAQQQLYGQNVGNVQLANQAQQQLYGQNLNNAQFTNQAQNQLYGQNANNVQLANQAQQQLYGQNLGNAQFTNQAQNQLYGQNANNVQMANAAQQQLYGQNLNNAQLANQAQQQLYGQNLNNAQFGNQAVQQSLAQQSALRSQPLNEILGLMGGSQIQLPQFQGYQGAQVAPAPTFAGAQAQGQNAMQNYGIQQSGNNALTSGLFGALTSGAMLASKFSDRRLKSNIVQVGIHPLGIGIYEYDIFGNRERGVMADEVAKVMPEAIIQTSSGYMMVNYGKL